MRRGHRNPVQAGSDGRGSDRTGLDWEQALVKIVEHYLEDTFAEELADSTTESELEDLSNTLGGIAKWCGIAIDNYRDQIDESIAGLTRSERENDQTPLQWEGTEQPMSERMQEAEVRRCLMDCDNS